MKFSIKKRNRGWLFKIWRQKEARLRRHNTTSRRRSTDSDSTDKVASCAKYQLDRKRKRELKLKRQNRTGMLTVLGVDVTKDTHDSNNTKSRARSRKISRKVKNRRLKRKKKRKKRRRNRQRAKKCKLWLLISCLKYLGFFDTLLWHVSHDVKCEARSHQTQTHVLLFIDISSLRQLKALLHDARTNSQLIPKL